MVLRKILFALLLNVGLSLALQPYVFADPCDCFEPWSEAPNQPYIGGCFSCWIIDVNNPSGCDYFVWDYSGVALHLYPFYMDSNRIEHRD